MTRAYGWSTIPATITRSVIAATEIAIAEGSRRQRPPQRAYPCLPPHLRTRPPIRRQASQARQCSRSCVRRRWGMYTGWPRPIGTMRPRTPLARSRRGRASGDDDVLCGAREQPSCRREEGVHRGPTSYKCSSRHSDPTFTLHAKSRRGNRRTMISQGRGRGDPMEYSTGSV